MTPPDRSGSPETCPVCGADVPRKARACPACGADEHAGWNASASVYDGLDLPDSAWAHDDAVRREFGCSAGGRPARRRFWLLLGAALAVFLLLAWLLGL